MPALDARDVRVSFGDVHALDGLSLTADEGSVTALLGPNGAGKTTFIRCCTALARPDSGSMSILGLSPGSPDVLPMIGLMPQSTGAWSGVRAGELLRYLASLYADPQPVDELIHLLGIAPFEKTPYRRLRWPATGGQPRRSARRAPCACLPRRADGGTRPSRQAADLGHRAAVARRGSCRAADHP